MRDVEQPAELVDVIAANQRFYDAHEARDLTAMGAVWEHSERTACVHPGWPILRGREQIEESWRQIFAGPGRNQFILTNLSAARVDNTAWVTVDENLVDGTTTSTVAATNLFILSEGGWRLVSHHGSPVLTG